MLSKSERFPLRHKIAIFKSSRRMVGKYVEIFWASPSETFSRGSVIVGKNVSLLAVRRNYLKRVVRQILHTMILSKFKGVFIIRLRSFATRATYAQLQTEIYNLVANR